MKPVKSLNELRVILSELLTKAQSLSRHQWNVSGERSAYDIPESEPCVVAFCDGVLSATWRRLKLDKSTEVFRITKVDRTDGPTPRRANFYLVKLASFLDKRGLYSHREVITDKTEDFKELTNE